MITKKGIVVLLKALAFSEALLAFVLIGLYSVSSIGTFHDKVILATWLFFVMQPMLLFTLPMLSMAFMKPNKPSILYLVQEGFVDINIQYNEDNTATWTVKSKQELDVEFNYGTFTLSYAHDPKSRMVIPDQYVIHHYPKNY